MVADWVMTAAECVSSVVLPPMESIDVAAADVVLLSDGGGPVHRALTGSAHVPLSRKNSPLAPKCPLWATWSTTPPS